MRFNDIVNKKLLVEGIKYGANQKQEVLNKLDQFRIGIEIEMQVPQRVDFYEVLESGYFDVNNRVSMEEVILETGADRDGFYGELARNLSSSLAEEIDEVEEYLDSAVDDFFLWVLDNKDVFEQYRDEDDPDKSYAILKGIVDKQRELSSETFGDFTDEYLPGIKTAMGTSEALRDLEGTDFIESLKEFMDELYPYIDDESLRPIENLDSNDIEFLTGEDELRAYVPDLNDNIANHITQIEKSAEVSTASDFYRKDIAEFYEYQLKKKTRSITSVRDIAEYFLVEEHYDDVEKYMVTDIIPLDGDDIKYVVDFDEDEIFEDVGSFEDMVIDLIDEEGYETSFSVEQEHDHQIEIITQSKITGDDIITAWDETWELVNMLKNRGMETKDVSGLHVSISMPGAEGKEPDLMKFMVVSNILNLIPKDSRNVRRHVNDIRNNYYNNIDSLIAGVWDSSKSSSNISQAYVKWLDKWLNDQTHNRGEKYQTVNFGKMDVEKGRIEIRMYGGEGYENNKNEIWNTVIRSMYALMVAYDRNFKRKEYLKTVNQMVQDIMKEKTGYDFVEFITRLKKMISVSDEKTAEYVETLISSKRATSVTVDDDAIKKAKSRASEELRESRIKMLRESGMRLKDLAKIAIDMEDADFYIKRRGSIDTVGQVSKKYDPYAIGVKIQRTDVINPDFLYYWFMNLHNQGHWKGVAKGTTNLVNITMDDIRNIKFG